VRALPHALPVLAKLSEEYGGNFVLAKVNADVEQPLAARYAVHSLPTVKIFKNGAAIDEFLGARPERTIRALLDRHMPRQSDALVYQALQELRGRNPEQALSLLQRARQDDPANDGITIELARILTALSRFEDAAVALKDLSAGGNDKPETVALMSRLEFTRIAADAPPAKELEKRIAANVRDNGARYQLSLRHALTGDHVAALDDLLAIRRCDRRFDGGAPPKVMLGIFNLLWDRPELVRKYRSLLYDALN